MFDEPYFLTKGGPGVSSQTIAMHIYRRGFGEYHFGYASTLGLILFLIVLLVTVVMFAFQNRWVHYDTE
jgi:multiple sugar transport system permease protein